MQNLDKNETVHIDDILEYLKENPAIFQDNPELLENVVLSDSRGIASLLEKQISALKARLVKFHSQQHELIEVVRENEQISDSFNEIICKLIGFTNLSEFASEFPALLKDIFDINEVSFKTRRAVEQKNSDNDIYDDVIRRLANKKAVCDDRWPNSITELFFSTSINSAALIPMLTIDNDIVGILALGSIKAERYTNDLATDHLNRLGLMAGICLARLQPSS